MAAMSRSKPFYGAASGGNKGAGLECDTDCCGRADVNHFNSHGM